MATDNTTVGQTILDQLGGRRFIVMTGARAFTALPNGLMFRLPIGSANKVRIILAGDDTYTVETFKVRGQSVKAFPAVDGVYADNLRDVFTRLTGLETSLGSLGRRLA